MAEHRVNGLPLRLRESVVVELGERILRVKLRNLVLGDAVGLEIGELDGLTEEQSLVVRAWEANVNELRDISMSVIGDGDSARKLRPLLCILAA